MAKSNTQKPFYITTAIAYPNSRMHVGFGWEAIGADMVARFHRMTGRKVFFCTGTDEHSQNVEKAAAKAGLSAKDYCDQMASEIKQSMERMDVAYDRFIRTSDPDHERVCQHLIEKAFKSGDVYKQKYEGLYCESCEVFYTEKETMAGASGHPECPTHKMALKTVSEENYFFRLSKYEERLKAHFNDHPAFLRPDYRRNEVTSFIGQGLKDFSVSRTSFKWGIALPFDSQHIIYVWYDALINYLSAVKYLEDPQFFSEHWPCDVHVIGKDITRFHTIYWPAMLWSAGIELPKNVFAHGFINLNGEKMSKTRGNIVTPDEVIADFGATSLRWYLCAANNFAGDGNYADQDIVLKCNADLSNNLGNLVNRVVSMTQKYFDKLSPLDRGVLPTAADGGAIESVAKRFEFHLGAQGEKLRAAIDAMDLSGYCARLIDFSMSLNKFIDETKPWALAKAMQKTESLGEERAKLESVLAQLLEGIRNLGIALWPVIPAAAEGILGQLGLDPLDPASATEWDVQQLHSGRTLGVPRFSMIGFNSKRQFKLQPPKPLFPRLEPKE